MKPNDRTIGLAGSTVERLLEAGLRAEAGLIERGGTSVTSGGTRFEFGNNGTSCISEWHGRTGTVYPADYRISSEIGDAIAKLAPQQKGDRKAPKRLTAICAKCKHARNIYPDATLAWCEVAPVELDPVTGLPPREEAACAKWNRRDAPCQRFDSRVPSEVEELDDLLEHIRIAGL
jgi:hypothetical protein